MIRRRSSLAFWILLVASAAALAGLASFLIHQENARQAEADARLLADQTANLQQRLAEYFAALQTETAKQLIAFHEEGLAKQLERWSAANALIASARIETAWPTKSIRETIRLEDPDTDASLRSGYYLDNLEIAQYENRASDPVLAWTLDSQGQWQAWHRFGPTQPARIATLDTAELVRSFDAFLQPFAGAGFKATISPSNNTNPISTILPNFALVVTAASDTREDAWLSRFGYGLVALSFALFAACAALLARHTERERREALRKTNFVSQVSHELKTPLTSIALYSDLLKEPTTPEDKRLRYLDTITRESGRLTTLIDNLLALSSVDQGKKSYRLAPTDLAQSVSEILRDYRPVIERSGMDINWEEPAEPARAQADSAVLRQALLNLLDNARKYAREGKSIEVSLSRDANRWNLAISDHGPGVPVKLREKIFEPFYQEKSSLADKSPGAGLGLSIARRMLRDCGGELSLDSGYTGGAQFVISLPIGRDASPTCLGEASRRRRRPKETDRCGERSLP